MRRERTGGSHVRTIIAGLMALTAMGASIIADVDPVTIVARGGVAFACGFLAAGLWNSFVNPQAQTDGKGAGPTADGSRVESESGNESENDEEEAA